MNDLNHDTDNESRTSSSLLSSLDLHSNFFNFCNSSSSSDDKTELLNF